MENERILLRYPLGIWNLGNTCYINSILQALACSDTLLAHISLSSHSLRCPKRVSECLLCSCESFLKLLNGNWSQEEVNYQIRRLVDVIYNTIPNTILGKNRQEDCHELLVPILQAFKSDEYYKSILSGRIESKVLCKQCIQKSTTSEPFLDISLDIQKAGNLITALRNYCKTEYLEENNAYYCAKCKGNSLLAEKSLALTQLPDLLWIQMKRFHFVGGHGHKIDQFIEYPLCLDLQEFMLMEESPSPSSSSPSSSTKYELIAFIEHQGSSLLSGHYVSYVRRAQRWFRVSDMQVAALHSRWEIDSQQAYMLLYQRCTNSSNDKNFSETNYVAPSSNIMRSSPVNSSNYIRSSSEREGYAHQTHIMDIQPRFTGIPPYYISNTAVDSKNLLRNTYTYNHSYSHPYPHPNASLMNNSSSTPLGKRNRTDNPAVIRDDVGTSSESFRQGKEAIDTPVKRVKNETNHLKGASDNVMTGAAKDQIVASTLKRSTYSKDHETKQNKEKENMKSGVDSAGEKENGSAKKRKTWGVPNTIRKAWKIVKDVFLEPSGSSSGGVGRSKSVRFNESLWV